ncbi:DinB family protein [Actinomadura bangladeshensis]|uniref:DinB family protein n=1 Tax=Actinomadura bangladeshensis TaxID=453573 RepID=A0A4V6PA61_9ACTN|nr:DinB family protein [Actinomadura bangladeshensis]TDC18106.1 DinB family protein [Actinomadura bangladeshensis]
MLDTAPLQDAYRELLDAAATVAGSDPGPVPPPGEWDADQILAHTVLINNATIAAVSSAATGTVTTYDNRLAQDAWTIDHVITLTGRGAELRDRVRHQADALCALAMSCSEAELNTPVPTLLLSKDQVLVDEFLPLRDLVTGLAEAELPGHTRQLLALSASD